ncbi:MAG: RecX family transcriptional regulator [Thermoleophilia bacterium]|nr:RecX family transcriptional regulator [Thermoleophilia bacterium]
MPDDVVARAGLRRGLELDRATRRRVRAEIARARGFAVAGSALARRDLAAGRVHERLRRAGLDARAAEDVIASLEQAGVLDDERAAQARAHSLAEGAWGDAAIAARLAAEGFSEELALEAVATLTPESERVQALTARVSDRRKAAARLSRRGFAFESLEGLAEGLD